MKYLLFSVLGIVVIIILILLVGVLLPEERKVTKIAYFESSSDKIFNVLTDLKGQVEWRNEIEEIIIHKNAEDKEEWTEVHKNGTKLRFETEEKIPYKMWKFKFQGRGFKGNWKGVYKEENNKTKVKHIERVEV